MIESLIAINTLPIRKNEELVSKVSTVLDSKENLALYSNVKKGDDVAVINLDLSNLHVEGKVKKYILCGRIGKCTEVFLISNQFSIESSTKLVLPVSLNASPKGFLFIEDEINWEIVEKNTGSVLNNSKMSIKICFIPHEPLGANRGVPEEAIRDLEEVFYNNDINSKEYKFSSDGESIARKLYDDPLGDLAEIVRHVYSKNPPKYDNMHGSASYIYTSGGDFNNITLYYGSYAKANKPTLNCYDTASIVQYLAQMTVGNSYWSFMKPFGFIKKTGLIGWGPCNNPFFGKDRTTQIIGEKNPKRTRFANHAFPYFFNFGVVADACVSGHVGQETKQQYLNNSLDNIFPAGCPANGTVKDITNYRGVTKVDTSIVDNVIYDAHNLLDFVASTGYNNTQVKNNDMFKFSSNSIALGKEWQLIEENIFHGYPIAGKELVFHSGDRCIILTIYASSLSQKNAHSHYLSIGSEPTMSNNIFQKGPQILGELSSERVSDDHSHYLWLNKNLVFNLRTFSLSTDESLEIAKQIHNFYIEDVSPANLKDFPVIKQVEVSKKSLQVGEKVKFTVKSIGNDIKFFFGGDHPGLYILRENINSFDFLAKKISNNNLIFYSVDPISLLSCKSDAFISIQ